MKFTSLWKNLLIKKFVQQNNVMEEEKNIKYEFCFEKICAIKKIVLKKSL